MKDQSQSSAGLLSTIQNSKNQHVNQLPTLLEVNAPSQLKAVPSQTSIQIDGNSPDRNAKEFLAARLNNNKMKASPGLQQVEPKVALSSHNRSGNTFMGNVKRNSNAVITNNN